VASTNPDANIGLPDSSPSPRPALALSYRRVRRRSEEICRPLAADDYGIQSMPDVSPPKWHLAHTTWFFEEFLLRPWDATYRPFHPRFAYLFNSYYQTVGSMHPRARRGLLSRPTTEEIYRYRAHVDEAMTALIAAVDGAHWADVAFRVTLGLHHEQQHQELLLTDIKHLFAVNPLRPAYLAGAAPPTGAAPAMAWVDFPGGVRHIGHDGDGFAFDNETPRHRAWVDDFRLASRPVTNGEYQEFMADGGYRRPELWLSDGWQALQARGWEAPLYWERTDDQWWYMTLNGMQPVAPGAPVCHVSLYEADAYARWRGARLPTEAEWETAATDRPEEGNFYESGALQPRAPSSPGPGPFQMFGDVWEWTQSPYAAYPGFKPLAGALGEYNGKFMCNQLVLRGGSCVTPAGHLRATYRNFFYPVDRWQFTGFRLAQTP
jgi:ergothioneine biosynthesis protein EgtB